MPSACPSSRPERVESKRGPRLGAPERALAGFLRANQLNTIDEAELHEQNGTQYYYAKQITPAKPTLVVLPELIEQLVYRFPWPKSMRWGTNSLAWIRPLRNLLCMLGDEIVPVELKLGSEYTMRATRQTYGHRFLAPAPFEIQDFADYQARLYASSVILDFDARRDRIRDGIFTLAGKEGLVGVNTDAHLDELAGLVEWPEILLGRIDQSCMDMPSEVLITAMRKHQRYVPLQDEQGNLAARFCVVSNITTSDAGVQIIAGNERVLRARLADARFFWDQDRAEPLASRLPALSLMAFHRAIGDMAARSHRLAELSRQFAILLPDCDVELAARAGLLAKADLTSAMVGEFPELQGVMGGYYATHCGEHDEVATAIAWQYRPSGREDETCPDRPVALALGLAERFDTIAALFAAGEIPSGSRDPFALRRAAHGIILLTLTRGLRLSVGHCTRLALSGLPENLQREGLSAQIVAFIGERLRVMMLGEGARHDLVQAIYGYRGEDDLTRMRARLAALSEFIATETGASLLITYRRAINLLRIEENREDQAPPCYAIDRQLLQLDEECVLVEALGTTAASLTKLVADEKHVDAMAALARLGDPVNCFFDRVTVNDERPTIRQNRLGILAEIRRLMGEVADFSAISGG